MYLIIDNTKDLEHAKMTPKILDYLDMKSIDYIVISKYYELVKYINDSNIEGIILSGGPICLSNKTELKNYSTNFTALIEFSNIPILGICFGYQVMCMAYGGIVDSLNDKVIGFEDITILNNSQLLKNLPNNLEVYQHHSDYVKEAPIHFNIISLNKNGRVEAIENIKKKRYGVQFHPENSKYGYLILDQFIKICKDNCNSLHNG